MTRPELAQVWPAFAVEPPHLEDPEGRWFAWLTDPPGVYDFTPSGVVVTDAFSTFMEGPVTELADKTFGATSKLTFLHDWRFVKTYSVTVRGKLVKWGLSKYGRTRVQTITALLSETSPLMVKMACSVGATLMAAGDVHMHVRTPRELEWENAVVPLPAARVVR